MGTFAVPLRSDRFALLGVGPLTVDAGGRSIRLLTRAVASGAPDNSSTAGTLLIGGNADSDDNRYAYEGTENVWARLDVQTDGAVNVTVLKDGATSASVAPFIRDREIAVTCDQDGATGAPGLLQGVEATGAVTVTGVAAVNMQTGARTAGTVGAALTVDTGVTITVAANGSYTTAFGTAYDALKADETAKFQIEITITDGGNSLTDKGLVTFTISGVNDGPSVTNRTKGVNEGATATGNLITDGPAATHPQGEAMMLTKIAGKPFSGNMPITLPKGVFTPKGDGSYTYKPTISLAAAATSDEVVSFTLADRWGAENTKNLTITITGV